MKTVVKSDIVDALRSVGLQRGDSVMVHTSLGKIGYVCGGAQVVIEALIESVGEEGTIMIVTPVREEEVIDTVNSTLENDESNNRATKIQAVDISFYYNDEEVEPLLPIKVSLTSKLIKESNKDPKIIHHRTIF